MKNIYLSCLILFVFFFSGCTDKSENTGTLVTANTASNTADSESIDICSFNIQFLGHFKKKDDASLADILKNYDIVVIQELVAPPYEGKFPDDTDYTPDAEAAEFFDAMDSLGFKYVLSEEDTGTNNEIHKNTSATEWWVAFYMDDKVDPAVDLPSGFLADDRSNHDDYERVPYAFAFKTEDEKMDFVLISVHLKPGDSNADQSRRKHELETIASWMVLPSLTVITKPKST